MLLPLLLLLLASARAACPPSPELTDAAAARAQVAIGDLAWLHADRGAARCAWRVASRAEDPAARAMGELRLLRVSGNLGLAVHGPRADRALAACPVDEPWCRLARADRDLVVRELGMGGDGRQALAEAQELQAVLPAAAAERALWAGADPAEVALPPAPEPSEQGAAADPWAELAAGLREQGGWPAGPGTWMLGLGVVAAPGLGTGPLLRFSHPDLGWRGGQLELEAWFTSLGAGQLRVGLRTRGRAWLTTGGAAGRVLVPVYDASGRLLDQGPVLGAQARAGLGLGQGRLQAWAGPLLREDRPAGASTWTPGHGLFGGVGAVAGPVRATLSSELSLWGPRHLGLVADLRAARPALGGTAALRVVGAAAPLVSSPSWRLPAWGGNEVLRSMPLGRLRAPGLAGLVGEWRHALAGPFGFALFGEGALAWEGGAWPGGASGLRPSGHGGGGGGLRLRLPPQPVNTVRLDLAAGDLGWAVSAGWGEAF